MRILLFTTLLLCASELVKSADILAVIPSPFYSHQATFRPLWRELSKNGHKITLITTDLMENNENITQIDYHESYEVFEKSSFNNMLKKGFNMFQVFAIYQQFKMDTLNYQFTHPKLVEMLKNNRTFDLMIVEMVQPEWSLLSIRFKCPFIGLTTMDTYPLIHASVGNAVHPALYPQADLGFDEPLSLIERVLSCILSLIGELVFRLFFSPFTDNYLKTLIGNDLPNTEEMYQNMSMLFVNANPVFFPVRPMTPITLNLGGGLHLTAPKQLPEDLQKYLDDAKDGCIYVSFGTTVNSEYLSKEQKDIFVNVFKSMAPMKVLWKFDDLNVAKDAKNVEVRNWVPQQDILRHPNVKLFITQGGLQSMEEAIDSAVPMLGMPFYGDQVNNVNKMHQKEFGVRLVPKEMDEKSLKSALEELLKNPKYKKTIDKLSAISKDQPMNGLEKAVWWTEYVLRHGTKHLRSPSADIPLYQYYFLDVIAFLIVAGWLMCYLIRALFKSTLSLIRTFYGYFTGAKEKKE